MIGKKKVVFFFFFLLAIDSEKRNANQLFV